MLDDMSHTVEGALVDASLIVELGINYRYVVADAISYSVEVWPLKTQRM